jgi:hypothetical protein
MMAAMRVQFRTAAQQYQEAGGMGGHEYLPTGRPSMEVIVTTEEGPSLLTIDLNEQETQGLNDLARRAANRYAATMKTEQIEKEGHGRRPG